MLNSERRGSDFMINALYLTSSGKGVYSSPMFTYAALAVIVVLLFVYLFIALLKPEWFS
jgi:K+-transporting ATPase KdpF subunit